MRAPRPKWKYSVLLIVSAALFAGRAAAADLHITTNLLAARPGSWIRRYAPHGHSYTEYVAANDGESVTLQLLREHDGKVRENRAVTLSHAYIAANAVDRGATATERVEHRGTTYEALVAEVALEDSPGRIYVTKALPASGVLRVDIIHPSGSITSLWTDSHGDEPDELLRKVPPDGEDTQKNE